MDFVKIYLEFTELSPTIKFRAVPSATSAAAGDCCRPPAKPNFAGPLLAIDGSRLVARVFGARPPSKPNYVDCDPPVSLQSGPLLPRLTAAVDCSRLVARPPAKPNYAGAAITVSDAPLFLLFLLSAVASTADYLLAGGSRLAAARPPAKPDFLLAHGPLLASGALLACGTLLARPPSKPNYGREGKCGQAAAIMPTALSQLDSLLARPSPRSGLLPSGTPNFGAAQPRPQEGIGGSESP